MGNKKAILRNKEFWVWKKSLSVPKINRILFGHYLKSKDKDTYRQFENWLKNKRKEKKTITPIKKISRVPIEFRKIASFENEVRNVFDKTETIRIKDLFHELENAGYRYSYRNFYRRLKNMPEIETVRYPTGKKGVSSIVILNKEEEGDKK